MENKLKYNNNIIQFSYNVTIYLTVLWRAAPALNQNLRSRAGGALTPIFRLRALQVHIWHSERPSALNLYMVLRACPAFNPYLAFRAPTRFQAIFCCSKSKNESQSAPTALDLKFCPPKYCQVESNVVSELNVSYRNMVWGNISRIVKGFHMVIVN